MRGDGEPLDPPTAGELAEAARLRERLEGGSGDPGPGVERTLALLALVPGSDRAADAAPLDDVAVRRLRRELVDRASRRRRPVLRAALQVAAALLVAALLAVGRSPSPPSAALLAAREAEAREAVARVLADAASRGDGSAQVPASTLSSLTRARNAELFSNLDSERLSLGVGLSSAGAERPDGLSGLDGVPATPTPGGAS